MKKITKNPKKIYKFSKNLISVKDKNYDLDNILVNTIKDIIDGYTYLYKKK